ncbi:hypothetical protein KCP73_16280 [Salmonella enterica subsp. enterica]|nr:hypothetical protein KCP73_16280 [Salmonella enterica subsp. enterica]
MLNFFQLLHPLPAVAIRLRIAGTIQYLQDCAAEAEIATEFLYRRDKLVWGRPIYGFAVIRSLRTCSVSASVGIYVARDVFHQAEDAGVRRLEPA